VLATIFRVQRAKRMIQLVVDLITLYVIAAVVISAYYIWQNGF